MEVHQTLAVGGRPSLTMTLGTAVAEFEIVVLLELKDLPRGIGLVECTTCGEP